MYNEKQDLSSKKENPHKNRNDVILIVSVCALALIGAMILFFCRTDGKSVVINVNGKHYATYSLSEHITVVIQSGELGDKKNTLIIENGKAWIQEADCPDLICKHHKPISYEGETIVCLPNKLVISIE